MMKTFQEMQKRPVKALLAIALGLAVNNLVIEKFAFPKGHLLDLKIPAQFLIRKFGPPHPHKHDAQHPPTKADPPTIQELENHCPKLDFKANPHYRLWANEPVIGPNSKMAGAAVEMWQTCELPKTSAQGDNKPHKKEQPSLTSVPVRRVHDAQHPPTESDPPTVKELEVYCNPQFDPNHPKYRWMNPNTIILPNSPMARAAVTDWNLCRLPIVQMGQSLSLGQLIDGSLHNGGGHQDMPFDGSPIGKPLRQQESLPPPQGTNYSPPN